MDMYSAGGVTVTDFRRRPYTEFLYKHLEGVNQQTWNLSLFFSNQFEQTSNSRLYSDAYTSWGCDK
jgi:hypothetical protein